MATTKYELAPGAVYTQIAALADTVVTVENAGTIPVFLQFAAALPAITAIGHKLAPGERVSRLGAGNVYALTTKASASSPAALLVVSI